MASHPYALRGDIAALWIKAIAVASDSATVWPVRGHAASVCLLLAAEIDYDDGLALTAVTAAATMLECAPYARHLLIAARKVARDESVLLDPMLALAAGAHAAGRHEAVVVALLELLQIQAFAGDVPSAWLADARVVTHESDGWLRRVVRHWVVRFGAGHDGVRAVARNRSEQWFPTNKLGVDVLRAIHTAEPTAAGWVALARRRAELGAGPLGLAFGDREADAVAAIREALLRHLPASDHAALQGWQRELAP